MGFELSLTAPNVGDWSRYLLKGCGGRRYGRVTAGSSAGIDALKQLVLQLQRFYCRLRVSICR